MDDGHGVLLVDAGVVVAVALGAHGHELSGDVGVGEVWGPFFAHEHGL